MKTGRYRIRQGWFGKAILQQEINEPTFSCGQVDTTVRNVYWEDVQFNRLSHVVFIQESQKNDRRH